ncbi:leucyl aminopeptidase family protein [Roseococcus sp. SDR]|uniref:leucyl aminopeptidase family protein n=1 Tax=Roseococcus sp. SDR TaxID=2835532 RepID=UPI001BCEBB2C|nr:leucyl aminopeptidase family protein [Roseococcus sp. SDR]MBS7792886.1 leucyl aminopeptidase family protein [Roseococcus sp. SDR]MBV1848200.1 leucyl aminopeptidase family protein [Roseococcus sp. SDR]
MLPSLLNDAPDALPLHVVTPESWEALPGAAFARAAGFAGKPGEIALLPGESGVAGALFGAPRNAEGYGALPHGLPEGTIWRLVGGDGAAAALGWALGAYRYTRFKPGKRAPARLVAPAGSESAQAVAAAICRGRDLINTPANHLGPAELVAAVGEVAAQHGARFRVIEGEELRQGFPAVQAVGQGSPRAPRIAVLEWGAADAPLVALCGKGVCFDTGGLDLKPSSAMLRMKKDMGGAAVMLALAEALMAQKAPIRLLLLIGAVENSVSGEAFRPLDVIRTRQGLTVEIGNTDAEGRLVLADLLTFAGEQQPSLILNGATLTGAARVALGPDLPALFSNDDALAGALLAGGQAVGDPLWRLPLHDGYANWLESPIADLNNVASKPMAGAIIAALFLRRFVPEGTPWAHLDLYAWNDATRPGRPEGGEATGMRAALAGLARFLDFPVA